MQESLQPFALPGHQTRKSTAMWTRIASGQTRFGQVHTKQNFLPKVLFRKLNGGFGHRFFWTAPDTRLPATYFC